MSVKTNDNIDPKWIDLVSVPTDIPCQAPSAPAEMRVNIRLKNYRDGKFWTWEFSYSGNIYRSPLHLDLTFGQAKHQAISVLRTLEGLHFN